MSTINYEKVNPSHPDKIADRIAGAIVDFAYSVDERPKIAVEVLIGHGQCMIITESSVSVPRSVIGDICRRITGTNLDLTIVSVPQDKELAKNQNDKIRCGDNGIFKGMPVTDEQKLMAELTAKIYDVYGTDGKYIISKTGAKEYDIIICQSHAKFSEIYYLLEDFAEEHDIKINKTINPLGYWEGGIDADSGATNRKLGSDMGDGVTGGGLMGKDLSKADVSVNIVAHNLAQEFKKPIYAHCAIGDENVAFYAEGLGHIITMPYENVVAAAKKYISDRGGFERFAELGLIR